MPIVPDASAFTQKRRLAAHQAQTPTNSVKPLTHLYAPMIRTAGVTEFLISDGPKSTTTRLAQTPTTKVMTNNTTYLAKRRLF
jgi:hypothetical protein